MGWGIEMIFFYEDKLFIGFMMGMFIYDNSNFVNFIFFFGFEYVCVCDFVYVKDDIVYVILRDGIECMGIFN